MNSIRRSPALHLLFLAAILPAIAAEPAAVAPKTHTLFMGVNLTIVSKDSLLPVKNVQQNSFVAQGPRGDIVIQPDDRQFQLKINNALKLTTAFATVDNLKFDRTYTPANDPMQKFTEAARVSAYMLSNTDTATATLRSSQAALGSANAGVANAGPLDAGNAAALQAQAAAQVASAQADYTQAQLSAGMDAFSIVSTSSRLNSEINAEQFDALRVTFTVSAPRPLRTPYVVIFMRFLQEEDRPDTASVWVYAERLPDIDEHPRAITVLRGGFPPGYHIDSYHVHLYEGPAEIATTVSPKRVALTTDEAFQYSVIQYVGAHRGETSGPAKAKAFWPADLHSHLLPDQLSRLLFVKVGKDGRAIGMFEDESCTKPVADAELAAVTPALRFFPALENGKPAQGVATVKLGMLN